MGEREREHEGRSLECSTGGQHEEGGQSGETLRKQESAAWVHCIERPHSAITQADHTPTQCQFTHTSNTTAEHQRRVRRQARATSSQSCIVTIEPLLVNRRDLPLTTTTSPQRPLRNDRI